MALHPKTPRVLFQSLAAVLLLATLACSGMGGGLGGGSAAPGGALDSGANTGASGSSGTDGGGGGSVAVESFDNPAFYSGDSVMSGGHPDPMKAVDKQFRIQISKVEDVCVSSDGQRVHMKVSGYLIPYKLKVASRVFRLVDGGEDYINIKTPSEPVDLGLGIAYTFSFEIKTEPHLPWAFFFFPPDEAPSPLIFHQELPCEANLCSYPEKGVMAWAFAADNYSMTAPELEGYPECPPSQNFSSPPKSAHSISPLSF